MNVTPTLKEKDIRPGDVAVDVIRFADDYQNKQAGACRITNDDPNGRVYLRNEGYSLVMLTGKEQVENLILALHETIRLGWVK